MEQEDRDDRDREKEEEEDKEEEGETPLGAIPTDVWYYISKKYLNKESFNALRLVNRETRDTLDMSMRGAMLGPRFKVLPDQTIVMPGGTEIYQVGNIGRKTFPNGEVHWYLNGELGREGDLPAIIGFDDSLYWYENGKPSRGGDQPAVVKASGKKMWYKDGKLTREGDKPTIIDADGTQTWTEDDGVIGRAGDKPAVIKLDGSKEWYRHGLRHRDGDKPAVISAEGTVEWWTNGRKTKIGHK